MSTQRQNYNGVFANQYFDDRQYLQSGIRQEENQKIIWFNIEIENNTFRMMKLSRTYHKILQLEEQIDILDLLFRKLEKNTYISCNFFCKLFNFLFFIIAILAIAYYLYTSMFYINNELYVGAIFFLISFIMCCHNCSRKKNYIKFMIDETNKFSKTLSNVSFKLIDKNYGVLEFQVIFENYNKQSGTQSQQQIKTNTNPNQNQNLIQQKNTINQNGVQPLYPLNVDQIMQDQRILQTQSGQPIIFIQQIPAQPQQQSNCNIF